MFNVSEAPTEENDMGMRGKHDKESNFYIDGGRKIQYHASGNSFVRSASDVFSFLASMKN
jgi:hypothetical protein